MQSYMAVALRVSICQWMQCNTALYFRFSCSFFFLSIFFSSSALPCETVVRTLEELPCTSVHVLDVRLPCENSGQRIPLPGSMQRQHRKMMGGSRFYILFTFACIFFACFNLLRLCQYTREAVVCSDVRVIEQNA